MKTIDFRKNGVQAVDGGHYTYIGKCPVTLTRLYVADGLGHTSNDPRGLLGVHAVEWFIASEYDMIGPDMAASWIACNNNRAVYELALKLAKKTWRER